MGVLTAGIDVGSSSIKTVLLDYDADDPKILFEDAERIRKRDPARVIADRWAAALAAAGVEAGQVAYVASTGEGELVDFGTGHFYGMTTHARGAAWLVPGTRTVLDVGALHARAIRTDGASRVVQYKMTGQCASGSGQFLENIARYLGVGLDEVGPLSLGATRPEAVSSICAVLAETDVINMVSRGIATGDILKGIHLSIAHRLVKLLRAVKAETPVTVTGGLARDEGLIATIREKLAEEGGDLEIRVHERSILAGALGAALWAGYRHRKLRQVD